MSRSFSGDHESSLAKWEQAYNPIKVKDDKREYSVFNSMANSTGISREIYSIVKGAKDNKYWKNLSLKFRNIESPFEELTEPVSVTGKKPVSVTGKKPGDGTGKGPGNGPGKNGDDEEERKKQQELEKQKQAAKKMLERLKSGENLQQIQVLTSLLQNPYLDFDKSTKSVLQVALNTALFSEEDINNDQSAPAQQQPIPEDLSTNPTQPSAQPQQTPASTAQATTESAAKTSPANLSQQDAQNTTETATKKPLEENAPVITDKKDDHEEEKKAVPRIPQDTPTPADQIDQTQDQRKTILSTKKTHHNDERRHAKSYSKEELKAHLERMEESPSEIKERQKESEEKKETIAEKLKKNIKELINEGDEEINSALETVASLIKPEESELEETAGKHSLKNFFKRKKNAILNRTALKIERFVDNRKEAADKRREKEETEKIEKEKKEKDKEIFDEEMKKLEPYSGINLVEELIDQHVDNNNSGLFDPKYLEKIKLCLKVLSKRGPNEKFYSRALAKLNYLEKTYNPREEPDDLKKKDFPRSKKDPRYLLDKFGFLDAVESEFKMLCHNSLTSINSTKSTSVHNQQKIDGYKCVIAFLGSTLRTSDDQDDANSCQYAYNILRKMHYDVVKRKDSYGYSSDSKKYGNLNKHDLEKYNLGLFRIMGIVLAHENLTPKDKSVKLDDLKKLKEELKSKYKKKFSEIQLNKGFSDLQSINVTQLILEDFDNLAKKITPTKMINKISRTIEYLKHPQNIEIVTAIFDSILNLSNSDDIKTGRATIIEKMFPSEKEEFDSTYFDNGKEGGRYIGFDM